MVLPQFLTWLANPDVAYILFVIGLLGLMGEVAVPGAIFPGVTGAICLVLGLVGLGQLPTNWGGAVLIAVAIVMFLLDLHVPGHGLSIGGVVAFALGSLLLFTPFWQVPPAETNVPHLTPPVFLAMTLGVAVFSLFGAVEGLKAQKRPVAMGRETLVGQVGTVRRTLDPKGVVHVEGEEWSAQLGRYSSAPIPAGALVRVVSVDGLLLWVEPVMATGPATTGEAAAATEAGAETIGEPPIEPRDS